MSVVKFIKGNALRLLDFGAASFLMISVSRFAEKDVFLGEIEITVAGWIGIASILWVCVAVLALKQK